MKKFFLLASVALFASCGSQNQKKNSSQEHGLDLSAMDTSVRPQDDFYNFVNGSWMKTAQIPPDKTSWGSFAMLREITDENCLVLLENLLKKNYPIGSEGQKIKDLYESYRDWNRRNADGLTPLQKQFDQISQIQSLADLQRYLEEDTWRGGNPICPWGVGADKKNSQQNAIYLGGFSLGMARDYYQKQSESNAKALSKYQEYLTALFSLIKEEHPKEKAKQIIDFESRIAQLMFTNEERRNPNITYNPLSLQELSTLVKNLNLPLYLRNVGVSTDRVIVGDIRLYKEYDNFVNMAHLPLLKDYLKIQLIASNTHTLNEELDNLSFRFYSTTLKGIKEQRPMNKRALGVINGLLGEAFGKLYVEKYFPPKAKEEMVLLIGYLKKSFATHIKQASWMSQQTKDKALVKLEKMGVKVGYPDTWTDYSKLVIEPASRASYFENIAHMRSWKYQKSLADVGKPVDKSRWRMNPQNVNAYYNPQGNEIVFPAAILQKPFFSFEADPAVNFGGIGAVIGHEMTHGFDDSGAEFDAYGNLENWWSPEDKANFKKGTQALAAQFDKYEPVKGHFVNGTFTSGENIADLDGVNIAFDALQLYLKDHGKVGKISGFTQEQRFFISWATVWRAVAREKYLINQVKTDPHTPQAIRAYAPLVNIDEWYNAFNVKEGDRLYKKPAERVKIW
ncbi:M13 family metallopeptidase [Capnocytophaga sp. oral taxon 338]|uniref:M13 family metallopeptidase n=1 Tax=Capnocytophaga sp. oral taxon 338 TaxID=710239 RepID=UPI000202ECF4|nr:M13 family metallopeptidase [Capnocytophaga sp. oral taxon 338]EGD34881.1 metalloendopeptidase PepO [Capnocytophaga sp. oral taxon 338 str. F0234]